MHCTFQVSKNVLDNLPILKPKALHEFTHLTNTAECPTEHSINIYDIQQLDRRDNVKWFTFVMKTQLGSQLSKCSNGLAHFHVKPLEQRLDVLRLLMTISSICCLNSMPKI